MLWEIDQWSCVLRVVGGKNSICRWKITGTFGYNGVQGSGIRYQGNGWFSGSWERIFREDTSVPQDVSLCCKGLVYYLILLKWLDRMTRRGWIGVWAHTGEVPARLLDLQVNGKLRSKLNYKLNRRLINCRLNCTPSCSYSGEYPPIDVIYSSLWHTTVSTTLCLVNVVWMRGDVTTANQHTLSCVEESWLHPEHLKVCTIVGGSLLLLLITMLLSLIYYWGENKVANRSIRHNSFVSLPLQGANMGGLAG